MQMDPELGFRWFLYFAYQSPLRSMLWASLAVKDSAYSNHRQALAVQVGPQLGAGRDYQPKKSDVTNDSIKKRKEVKSSTCSAK